MAEQLVDLPDRYDNIYVLRFEDPELSHLKVKVRRSYGLIDAAAALPSIDVEAVKAGRPRPEDLQVLRTLVDEFAGALVSWNIRSGGKRVPCTREAVRGLDVVFVLALVAAFWDALADMAQTAQAELEAVGGEASLPMEVAGD